MLEFKPKTPIPDIYSLEFLTKFAEKNNLPLDSLIQQLKSSPNGQKIRWFKKNALKAKKNNMNSLDIFGFEGSSIPKYKRLLKKINKNNEEECDSNLSSCKIAQYLKQTEILNQILKLQLLYFSENDFRSVQLSQLWN